MRRVGSFSGPTSYRPSVSDTTEPHAEAPQEDVFVPARMQRSSSMSNIKLETLQGLDFEGFMDQLPRVLFIKFKTPFWQNLFWQKNDEVQRALAMIIEPATNWNTPRLHAQLQKAGLHEILNFVKKQ